MWCIRSDRSPSRNGAACGSRGTSTNRDWRAPCARRDSPDARGDRAWLGAAAGAAPWQLVQRAVVHGDAARSIALPQLRSAVRGKRGVWLEWHCAHTAFMMSGSRRSTVNGRIYLGTKRKSPRHCCVCAPAEVTALAADAGCDLLLTSSCALPRAARPRRRSAARARARCRARRVARTDTSKAAPRTALGPRLARRGETIDARRRPTDRTSAAPPTRRNRCHQPMQRHSSADATPSRTPTYRRPRRPIRNARRATSPLAPARASSIA